MSLGATEPGIDSLDGGWIEESHGVDPDIDVDNMPEDQMAGRDPPLGKAVEVLLEKIRQEPIELPEIKRYPKDRK